MAEIHVEIVRIRILPGGRMTRKDAAAYLGREAKTLAMWAVQGKGPRAHRAGGRCFYYKEDLDAFLQADSD